MYILKVFLIRHTLRDITYVKKNIPSDKINSTKNAFFFLLRVSTHHSFTFNLRFLI